MIKLESKASTIALALLVFGASACDRSSGADVSPSPQGSTSPQAAVAPETPPAAATTTQQAQASTATPGTDISGAPTALDVSNLDDPGQAAVLQSLHQRIAQEAQLAATNAGSQDVKQQARDASAFHMAAIASYQKLFKRLGFVPRVNPASQQIDTDAASVTQALGGLRGADFDREYLDRQSKALGESLQVFDRILSVAKSSDLKAEIQRNTGDIEAQRRTVVRLQHAFEPGVTNKQPPSPSPFDPQLPTRRPMP
jgi:hypothetical protein